MRFNIIVSVLCLALIPQVGNTSIMIHFNTTDPFEIAARSARLEELFNNLLTPTDVNNGVMVDVDAQGNVTMMGNPTGMASTKLKSIIDSNKKVNLHLEAALLINNMVKKITIGAWRRGVVPANGKYSTPGNGNQSIDLNDLWKVESYKNMKNPRLCGASREAYFFHELVEAFEGVSMNIPYEYPPGSGKKGAHDLGTEAENLVIRELHGQMNYGRHEEWYSFDPNKNCIYFYYRDLTNIPSSKVSAVKITRDNQLRVLKTDYFTCVTKYRKYAFNSCSPNDGFCSIIVPEGQEPSFGSIPNTSELSSSYFAKGPHDLLLISDPSSVGAYLMDTLGSIVAGYFHAQLSSPAGIVYGQNSEEVFVADDTEEKVFVFDLDGTFKRILTNVALSIPAELDLDFSENLIVSNHGAGNILVLDPSNGSLINTISSPELTAPAGIAFDMTSNHLFVVDNTSNRVLLYEYDSGAYEGIFGDTTRLSSPWGIDILGGKFDTLDIPGGKSNSVREIVVASQGNNSLIVYDTSGTMIDSLSSVGMNAFDVVVIEFNKNLGTICPITETLMDTTLMTSNIALLNTLIMVDSVFIPSNQDVLVRVGESFQIDSTFEIDLNATLEVLIEEVDCNDPP